MSIEIGDGMHGPTPPFCLLRPAQSVSQIDRNQSTNQAPHSQILTQTGGRALPFPVAAAARRGGAFDRGAHNSIVDVVVGDRSRRTISARACVCVSAEAEARVWSMLPGG